MELKSEQKSKYAHPLRILEWYLAKKKLQESKINFFEDFLTLEACVGNCKIQAGGEGVVPG